jgi:hypothetical protein
MSPRPDQMSWDDLLDTRPGDTDATLAEARCALGLDAPAPQPQRPPADAALREALGEELAP